MKDTQQVLWDELEHCCYLAMVPLFETVMKLEPCPAMKLANEWCGRLARELKVVAESLRSDEAGEGQA